MGIQPFMITATVEAVLAQRLVRRICQNCKEPADVSDELLVQMQLTRETLGEIASSTVARAAIRVTTLATRVASDCLNSCS